MREAMQIGVYQHYKGLRYEVLAIAKHFETLEEMVIYRALYGDFELWIRPLNMFLEEVEYFGVKQPRFKFLHLSNQVGDPDYVTF